MYIAKYTALSAIIYKFINYNLQLQLQLYIVYSHIISMRSHRQYQLQRHISLCQYCDNYNHKRQLHQVDRQRTYHCQTEHDPLKKYKIHKISYYYTYYIHRVNPAIHSYVLACIPQKFFIIPWGHFEEGTHIDVIEVSKATLKS